MICRRERAHPGAQLSFTDHDGHRFQIFLTDQDDPDIASLELRQRQRAHAEDHIRNDKDTGLAKLPFKDFQMNQVWVYLVLIAHDLITWSQTLLLDGQLANAEPKRLRYRMLHTAARLAFHGRRAQLKLQATWPRANELAAAFARLQALPTPGTYQVSLQRCRVPSQGGDGIQATRRWEMIGPRSSVAGDKDGHVLIRFVGPAREHNKEVREARVR